MTPQLNRPGRRRSRRNTFLLLIASLLTLVIAAPFAYAWPEGVYINGSTYFTLEQVSYSTGTDSGLLKFNLRLHNGSSQDVDFNYYGARVTDSQGRSFTATQVGKVNARVQPGKEQTFAFTARTASGLKAGDMKVTLFQWDYSLPNYMRDLGALSVAAAIQEAGNTATSETTVDLSLADASLNTGTSVSFRLEESYMVHQTSGWNTYTDLTLTNSGSASVKLPAGLKYRLTNAEGQLFAATVVQGGDQPILPGASRQLIVQAAVSEESQASAFWNLDLYKEDAGSETLLGSLGLANSSHVLPIGTEKQLSGTDGTKPLAAAVESSTVTKQGDQVLVQASVRVSNKSSRLVALPAYGGQVQLKSVGLSAAAAVSGSTPAYLSPNASTMLSYYAVMPAGIPEDQLQFVLLEPTAKDANGTGQTLPVLMTDLSNATPQQGVVGAAYTVGEPLKLQPSQLVNDHLDTALMDFRLYENVANGYKTAVAKFKLTNTGTSTIAMPEWSTELIGEDGLVYSGSVIKPGSQEVAPNTSYMLTFTYLVPNATEGQTYTIHLYDGKTAAPVKLTLGAFKTALLADEEDRHYSLYPYGAIINDFSLFYAFLNKTYTFQFRVDLDLVKKEQLLVDAATSTLQFDLVDADGNPVATQTLAFNAIKNGSTSIKFTNDQLSEFSNVYHILVYDVIENGTGSLRRLLADLKAEN
ncbi:hypothetical protein [Paenibacillus sp. HJGM_3]|uniref:hypothetical protein n=1 Tax=Paenibacillus sp. HJGM_3 TaxID=3379816 RepID=UPI00385A7EAF